MKITVHRLQIKGANWSKETITDELIKKLSNSIIKLPLSGDVEENEFGFAQCHTWENKILGVFIQKFPTILINYDAKTKEEEETETIDCGEYLFLLDLYNYVVYLQAKRSPDLPSNQEIQNRFVSLLKTILNKDSSLMFEALEETVDEVNRDKIVHIFYEEAERVLELELEDFDINLIESLKRKRKGKRQTYFNPIEEYQEAMEAGAIKAALNTEKAYLKAKKGQSLKKDPISRALLEGSKKPTKITFVQNGETVTEFGVTKSKLEFNVESDNYHLNDQALGLISNILGGPKPKQKRKDLDDDQLNFDF